MEKMHYDYVKEQGEISGTILFMERTMEFAMMIMDLSW